MIKSKLGDTHAAHETRHLARKMQNVREGKLNQAEREKLFFKLIAERVLLIDKYEDCCCELGIKANIQKECPKLTVEEAEKHKYVEGLEPSDFAFISKFETSVTYGTPAPLKEQLHMGTMLLQTSINELAWAISEISAHDKQ